MGGMTGGADRDLINLVNALDPREFQVVWVGVHDTSRIAPYLDGRIVRRLVDGSFSILTLGTFLESGRTMGRWSAAKTLAAHLARQAGPVARLVSELRGERFDLVLTGSSVVSAGSLFAAILRVPHVWLVKEIRDGTSFGGKWFGRFISRMSAAVVSPSRAVAARLEGGGVVLPDGSPIREIRKSARRKSRRSVLKDWGLPAGRPVVGQVGWVAEVKGPHLVIEALGRLARNGAPPFSLVFMGDVRPKYRTMLDLCLQRLPPRARGAIRFVRFDPGDYSSVGAADVIVHPPLIEDSFPNAIREAMILGKPVVATRTGGIPELVRAGVTGFLVERNDAEAIAERVNSLVRSAALRRRMGGAARRFADRYLDIRKNREGFVRLFRSLARNRGGAPRIGPGRGSGGD